MEHPPEVEAGCKNARLLARVCDLLELEPRSQRTVAVELEGTSSRFGRYDGDLVGEYDPDVDPYFWELD